jgi:hypothetical protein
MEVNRMAELKKSKLPRKLVVLALLIGCLVVASPQSAFAAGDPTGCGDPYRLTIGICQWWDVFGLFCEVGEYGCADCTQGTFCYPLYN